MSLERIEVRFSGRVQGVGFRYQTRDLSIGRDVTGYVQNLMNGDVFLVVEGHTEEINRFLDSILERMKRNITGHSVEHAEYSGEWDDFSIRYDHGNYC